jgi:hypothetical protein
VVDGVLQFILVATAPRSDGLPGSISHTITDRCSEGWPLVPVEDLGSGEYLYNYLEFHPPWMHDSLDPVSWGGGDAQLSQQGMKPTGRDRGFSTEGFPSSASLYSFSPSLSLRESTLHCLHLHCRCRGLPPTAAPQQVRLELPGY